MTEETLIRQLAEMATDAPVSLLPKVLVETGIAHGLLRTSSAVGDLLVAFSPDGITSVELADERDRFAADYEERFGRKLVETDSPPENIARHLDRAIEEGRPGRLHVDLGSLTQFQADVLKTAALIPRGEVRPYGWIAKELGRPGASRAVGSALAGNPVPLILPCHRVVRSDGRLGNYSLGSPENKRRLLEHEGMDTRRYEALASSGVRFTGSDTTHIFCHPTCRHARRTGEAHQVEFRSEEAARQAGYRPCLVCRPVAA